jgi:hypothetical protein
MPIFFLKKFLKIYQNVSQAIWDISCQSKNILFQGKKSPLTRAVLNSFDTRPIFILKKLLEIYQNVFSKTFLEIPCQSKNMTYGIFKRKNFTPHKSNFKILLKKMLEK